MRKIPTVFKRDPENRRNVLPEITPGCEWVLAGEGTATRKYDGTCTMLDSEGNWWGRREVKLGKPVPNGFEPVQHDETTGKTVGWEPIAQSPFAKFHAEALTVVYDRDLEPGTYELCGPKINGNPERFDFHVLQAHAEAEQFFNDDRSYEGIRMLLVGMGHVEGIVYHHEDGRMAKIKRRDFS